MSCNDARERINDERISYSSAVVLEAIDKCTDNDDGKHPQHRKRSSD